jgi:Leucine-rich repeat (LRR) protein
MLLKEGFKAEDRIYLNKFKQLKKLSVNSVQLKTLDNFPEVPLQKLEVSDNHIKGDELKKLVDLYKNTLISLKACNNKISDLEQVVTLVKGLTNLSKLDLTDNEVCKLAGYREKLFAANENLMILD